MEAQSGGQYENAGRLTGSKPPTRIITPVSRTTGSDSSRS